MPKWLYYGMSVAGSVNSLKTNCQPSAQTGRCFVNINGDYWKEREKAVEKLDGLEYDREQKWERPVVLDAPTGRNSITLGQSVE
jgi:hypothetical protein